MKNSLLNLITGCEDNEEVINQPEPKDEDDLELRLHEQDMDTAAQHANAVAEMVDELSDKVDGMECMLGEGEFSGDRFQALYQRAGEITTALELQTPDVLGAEALQSPSNMMMYGYAGLEGFVSAVAEGAKKIWEAIKKALVAFLDFFFGIEKKTEAKMKDVKSKLDSFKADSGKDVTVKTSDLSPLEITKSGDLNTEVPPVFKSLVTAFYGAIKGMENSDSVTKAIKELYGIFDSYSSKRKNVVKSGNLISYEIEESFFIMKVQQTDVHASSIVNPGVSSHAILNTKITVVPRKLELPEEVTIHSPGSYKNGIAKAYNDLNRSSQAYRDESNAMKHFLKKIDQFIQDGEGGAKEIKPVIQSYITLNTSIFKYFLAVLNSLDKLLSRLESGAAKEKGE